MATANQQKFEREKREIEQNHQSQVIRLMHFEIITGNKQIDETILSWYVFFTVLFIF